MKWTGIGALGTIAFVGCGIPDEEIQVQSPAQMPEDLVSGLEAWYATACHQCEAREGIIVRVIEGRAIKVEGNPDHPVSQGKSFATCQAGLQALYNPDRLTGPMGGPRGASAKERGGLGWDEAISTLVARLKSVDPRSVVLVTEPLRGSLGMVAQRFASAYGARHMAYETMEHTVLRAAVKQVFGQEQIPDFDIANADYVLNFGADFLGTWLSPVRYNRAYGEFRQGSGRRGTLVQVEPRFSMTAANADRWVYINPGWEGAMALSIAYVLLSEHAGSIDRATADAMTGGGGAAVLAKFAPETVAGFMVPEGVAGLSKEDMADKIKQVAKELAEHPRSLVIGGGSAAAHTNGLFNLSAIYSLNHLVGSVGRIGGVIFNPESPLDEAPARAAVASFAEWEKLAEEMRGGKVKLLMVMGTNPVYGLPGSVQFAKALEGVETVVSFSSFMDETVAMADLVLPDHVYLEAWGDDISEPGPGYQTVTFQQPVVHPFHQSPGTRAFGDVLLQVASQLGGPVAQALPWPTVKDVVRANAQKLQAQRRGSVQAGEFEAFWNTALQRGGWWNVNERGPAQAGRPPRAPQQPAIPEFEGSMNDYRFYLVPFSSLSLTDGKGANLPWLQATPDPMTTATWHTWAEVSLKDAEALGIKEGDELLVESPAGSIRVLAYPHLAAAPGVISIPTGQGHTDYGDFQVGPPIERFRSTVAKGRGANVFSILATRKDKETGALAWAATRVKVTRTGNWVRLSKFEGHVTPMFPEEVIPLARPG